MPSPKRSVAATQPRQSPTSRLPKAIPATPPFLPARPVPASWHDIGRPGDLSRETCTVAMRRAGQAIELVIRCEDLTDEKAWKVAETVDGVAGLIWSRYCREATS